MRRSWSLIFLLTVCLLTTSVVSKLSMKSLKPKSAHKELPTQFDWMLTMYACKLIDVTDTDRVGCLINDMGSCIYNCNCSSKKCSPKGFCAESSYTGSLTTNGNPRYFYEYNICEDTIPYVVVASNTKEPTTTNVQTASPSGAPPPDTYNQYGTYTQP